VENLINVKDPETGEIGSIPQGQLQEAASQGYEQVTPEEALHYVNVQKYSTPVEKLKTFAEGAASAATLGLSTGAERLLGAEPEAIQARREINPALHGTGEMVGLVGSALFAPEATAAGLMEKAGAKVATELVPAAREAYDAKRALDLAKEAGIGIEEAQSAYKAAKAAQPYIAKIGSSAANEATQFALMSAGDEVSKMFAGNPPESVGTALAEVGLNGLIGGVTGGAFTAVSPLWEATLGKKLETFLEKVKNRADGNSIPVTPGLEEALKNVTPEMRAAMSGDPEMLKAYQTMVESGSSRGDIMRDMKTKFQDDLNIKMKDILQPGEEVSAFEAGSKAIDEFNKIEDKFYKDAQDAYKSVGDLTQVHVNDEARLKLYDEMVEAGQKFGAVGGPGEQLFKTYSERFLAQDTLGQMDKLVTEINSASSVAQRAGDWEKVRALSEIKTFIRDFQEQYLDKEALNLAKATGDENIVLAAQLAKDQRADARKLYKEYMDARGEILGMGGIRGVKSHDQFVKMMEEKIEPSMLAKKLFNKDKIRQMTLLQEKYPEIFRTLAEQKKSEIWEAANKSGLFNARTLERELTKLPKEVYEKLFSKEEQKGLNTYLELMHKSSERIGPSGTPRGLDQLWAHLPMGVGAMASTILGHGPVWGMIAGKIGEVVGKEIPEAYKMAMLKFLGSSGEVSSKAFKATVDYAAAIHKGDLAITKAAGQIFSKAPAVTARSIQDQEKARKKLQKRIDEWHGDQEAMLDTAGHTSLYLPDHSMKMAETASSTVNYLNSLKPQQQKMNVLDSKPVVNPMAQARYNRALDIANRPMIVLDDVKNGKITTQDVQDLKAMFPGAYDRMQTKIMDKLTTHMHEEKPIPYQTKLGLSVFLGQPLDSTMQPQAILATQNLIAPNQQQGQTIEGQRQKHSFAALNKLPGMYLTPQQQRQIKT
jgi:hypothetical protein